MTIRYWFMETVSTHRETPERMGSREDQDTGSYFSDDSSDQWSEKLHVDSSLNCTLAAKLKSIRAQQHKIALEMRLQRDDVATDISRAEHRDSYDMFDTPAREFKDVEKSHAEHDGEKYSTLAARTYAKEIKELSKQAQNSKISKESLNVGDQLLIDALAQQLEQRHSRRYRRRARELQRQQAQAPGGYINDKNRRFLIELQREEMRNQK